MSRRSRAENARSCPTRIRGRRGSTTFMNYVITRAKGRRREHPLRRRSTSWKFPPQDPGPPGDLHAPLIMSPRHRGEVLRAGRRRHLPGPMEVLPERRRALAIRCIVTSARMPGREHLTEKLAGELLDASRTVGAAL